MVILQFHDHRFVIAHFPSQTIEMTVFCFPFHRALRASDSSRQPPGAERTGLQANGAVPADEDSVMRRLNKAGAQIKKHSD